jgi:hypothetical protein
MRGAVILATLTGILFAVAGVTAATENTFTSSSQDGEQKESTVAGRTAPGATLPEITVPETTVPEDIEKPIEGTEETTVVVHEEPKEPSKEDPGAGTYGGIQDDNSIEKTGEPTGKPKYAHGGKKYGEPPVAGKPPGKSRSATGRPDHGGEKGFDGDPGKVTICHKGRVTISVGAPAKRVPGPAPCSPSLPGFGAEPVKTRAWGSRRSPRRFSRSLQVFARKLIFFEDAVNGGR